MIRSIIVAIAFGLVAGSFISTALANSNATVLQAAQIGRW